MNKTSKCTVVILLFAHFTICSLLPIYNKELFKRFPFPIYSTFLQMGFSVLPSFIIAWWSVGFKLSIKWAIPPVYLVPRLIMHSFLYGGMMFMGNLGFYVSSLDFAVLFRLATIVSSGLCGLIFLGERISISGSFAILLVLGGLFLLTSNFQWSTAKMPTGDQFLVQVFAVFTSSLASLMLKLTIRTLNESEEGHNPFLLLFWRFFFGSIPVYVAALIVEPNAVITYDLLTSSSYLWMTFLGVMLSGVFQILNTILHDVTTLVTLTIISQMKIIPTLIISHFLYNETKWTAQQMTGALLLIVGASFYSLSRIDCSKKDEDIQEAIETNQAEELLDNKTEGALVEGQTTEEYNGTINIEENNDTIHIEEEYNDTIHIEEGSDDTDNEEENNNDEEDNELVSL